MKYLLHTRIVVPLKDQPELNNNVHEMRCLLDWVAFTFPDETDHRIAFSILDIPETEFKTIDKGMNGYRKQLRCKHITILYDGSERMGTHVILSGQGCREYEQRMQRSNALIQNIALWKDLIRTVFDHRGKFTRLDIAIDDFKPHFKIEQVYRKIKGDLVNSKFDDYKMIESGSVRQNVTGDAEAGMTIYFGSDYSNTQIVFYDKYREREKNGEEVDPNVKGWNRVEIRLFQENTHSASVHILHADELGKVAKGILHNYVEILEKSQNDSNRTRWGLWRNWAKFLGDVEKLKLTHIAPDRSIEKSAEWIDRQVKKTIAKLFVADEGRLDRLQKWVEEGSAQFDEDDLYDIEVYQHKQKIYDVMKSVDKSLQVEMFESMQRTLKRMKENHESKKKSKKNSLLEGTSKPILE